MIEGEHIIITGMTKEALPLTLEWVNDPEYKYYNGTVFPISEFEHYKFMENKIMSHHDKVFLIREKETNREIGFIGLKNTDLINSNAEIYGSIGKIRDEKENNYGKGYGSEAFRVFSDFAFNTLNLHKIYSKVYSYNIRSQKAFVKAGFCCEALLKEHHFIQGRYQDIIVMSKMRPKEE